MPEPCFCSNQAMLVKNHLWKLMQTISQMNPNDVYPWIVLDVHRVPEGKTFKGIWNTIWYMPSFMATDEPLIWPTIILHEDLPIAALDPHRVGSKDQRDLKQMLLRLPLQP